MSARVGEIPAFTRQGVYNRDGFACRRCHVRGASIHHRRKRRGKDAHLPSNLVLLCGDGVTGCHGWVEAHPQAARESGWWIDQAEPDTAEMIPLTDIHGDTVVLLDDWSVLPVGQRPERVRR